MAKRVGKCPGCGKRRVLGRCATKGGGAHCRQCCDSPSALKWKPSLAGAVLKLAKKK